MKFSDFYGSSWEVSRFFSGFSEVDGCFFWLVYLFFWFFPVGFLSCFGSPRLMSTMVLWKICRYAFAESGLEHLGDLTFYLWVKFYVKPIAGGSTAELDYSLCLC